METEGEMEGGPSLRRRGADEVNEFGFSTEL